MAQRVLFVCSANSARSQMAEAFLRTLAGDAFEADSAGSQPEDVHPLAIAVMSERGVDISGPAVERVCTSTWARPSSTI